MSNKQAGILSGQGLVEYALLLVLVAVVVIVVLALLGPSVGNVFSDIMSPLENTDPGDNPPGDCYSSLLISIMVGVMGFTAFINHFLQNQREKGYHLEDVI